MRVPGRRVRGRLCSEGTLTKGQPETIDGQLMVDADGGKAYVALTGQPRLLKFTDKSGEQSLEFTYDAPVELKAPPKDQVFDPTA